MCDQAWKNMQKQYFFCLFNVESGLVLGRYLAKISEERFNFSEFTNAANVSFGG